MSDLAALSLAFGLSARKVEARGLRESAAAGRPMRERRHVEIGAQSELPWLKKAPAS